MCYTGNEELDMYTFGFDVRSSCESANYIGSCRCFAVEVNATLGLLFSSTPYVGHWPISKVNIDNSSFR